MPAVKRKTGPRAFTRIELLALVASIFFMCIALLPAFGRTHPKSQTIQCLNNLRQLSLAWISYANESNGKLMPNHGVFPANPDYQAFPRWVAGDMRGASIGAPYTGIDATNSALLVNPKFSELGPYVKDPSLFKCPADQSTWMGMPRVRSYSMNNAVGSLENGFAVSSGQIAGHWLSTGNASPPGGSPWRIYLKEGDVTGTLGPADLFLLVDEHINSINDATFSVQMPQNPTATFYIDVPTQRHNNGCTFSFADGHAETHRWLIPAAIPPEVLAADTGVISGTGGVAANPDVLWLAHHTSALAAGISTNGFYQP
jgi:prepilin-type processing-associated H-X9-DG protein